MSMRLPVFAALILMSAASLFCVSLSRELPPQGWLAALVTPDPGDITQLIVHHTLMSRAAAALMAGAALGLSGVILQIMLGNPLAEPGTLGISAGAQLALVLAAAFLGADSAWSKSAIALAGGGSAIAIVVGLSWRSGLAPIRVVMTGLVLNFCAGSIIALIALFNHEFLRSLFIWSTGSLRQNDWSASAILAPALLAGIIVAAALARPLAVSELGESSARSVGLSPVGIRLAALAVASALAALTTAAVGAIGFVGLAAPHVARIGGARTLTERLLWTTVLGAGILWLADEAVKLMSGMLPTEVATGSATALLGAPLLLWLAPQLKAQPPVPNTKSFESRLISQAQALRKTALLLISVLFLCSVLIRGPEGWIVIGPGGLPDFAIWHGPRIVASLAAGILLGTAGMMMTRLTGNPMAGPDIIGVSAGASFGFLLVLYISPFAPPSTQIFWGSLCATALAVLLLHRNARQAQRPEQLLVLGVSLSALLGALVTFLMATGDPRMMLAFVWLSGSTYRVTANTAALLLTIASLCLVAGLWLRRWLEMLPLGPAAAQAAGVPLSLARACIIVVVSVATATATLLIGPLSFVGLLAPELARRMGLRLATHSLVGACCIGGSILVAADWFGRNVIFPYEMPAGLVASVLGCLCFMLMSRTR